MAYRIDFFMQFNGHKEVKRKHKFYATKKAFDVYWKYHAEFEDYMNSIRTGSNYTSRIAGYDDKNKCIRRHPT